MAGWLDTLSVAGWLDTLSVAGYRLRHKGTRCDAVIALRF